MQATRDTPMTAAYSLWLDILHYGWHRDLASH
jgi:hypothetical protein